MGYVYEATATGKRGRLCCDKCGNAGGVRKRNCPYGWCQSPALCGTCYTETRVELRAYHDEHCKESAAAFAAQQQFERVLLDSGAFLRVAALGLDRGDSHIAHVIFRNTDHDEIGYTMAIETYRAIPLTTPATPESFKAHGAIVPASTNLGRP